MNTVVEAISELLNVPETIEKFLFSSPRSSDSNHHHRIGGGGGAAAFPADILDTPREYVFYVDVPGLSKSDIQVTVEEENTLVIKSSGKRKREDGVEEEGCKYVKLERRPPQKLMRKFRLPENSSVSAITARCENGVLTVAVEKLPPAPKSKTVEVTIS